MKEAETKMVKLPTSFLRRSGTRAKPFSEDDAFAEMYWWAEMGESQTVFDKQLKEGQLVVSINDLIERWGWSEESVYIFLYTLSSDFVRYIHIEEFLEDTDTIVITMLKYDEFIVTA